MLSLSGSCIPQKVSLTVKKKLFLFFRVIIACRELDTPRNREIMERDKTLVTTHYKEPGQDGQFDDCTKDVLEELCEDDYSDAEEELEANLDADQHLKLIDESPVPCANILC